MTAERTTYGAPASERTKIPVRSLLLIERVPLKKIRWRWEVLWYAGLNVVAMAPMAWAIPSGSDSPPLSFMIAMFAAMPLIAYLQPWIGVLSLLRIMRVSQLILLPLLIVLAVLSIPLALLEPGADPDFVRIAAGLGGGAAAVVSMLGQIRLWRTTAWTLQLEARSEGQD